MVGLAAQEPVAPVAPAAPAAATKAGRCYVVTVHGGDDVLAQQALDAAERAWPIVAAAFGVADAPPPAPLAVHLYRTIGDYQQADQQLTNGRFQRNLAMSHWESRSSHVAVQPPCSDETLRAVGLPALTLELLAWEAAHLARFQLCPNFRNHPMWFADGLGAATGRAVAEVLRPGGGLDQLPTMATDVTIAQRLLGQKKLPAASSILADAIDELDFGDRYAVRAVFFRFLQGDAYKGKLPKLAEVVRATGGGEGYARAVQAAAAKIAGGTVDKDFAAFVQKARPKWREVYRSLSTAGKAWPQIAFPNRNAVAWNLEPVKGGKLYARGTLRILPGGRQQLNFLFARSEAEDFYSLAFVADQGFTVFRYDGANDAWSEVGKANAPALRLGYGIGFAVESTGKDLVVRLDEQSWNFTLPVPLPKDVYWGLGAQAGPQDGPTGSAGLWSDVAVGAKPR